MPGPAAAKAKLFLRVLCFTLGISGAFFILGLGASAAGSFFGEHRMLFARIGGVLIILFGLYQMGLFGSSRVLGEEHRLPFRLEKMTMSPLTALIMGFTFSFAWTPCVGPAYKRAPDGRERAEQRDGIPADRGVYAGVHPAVPCGRDLHGAAARIFPAAYEGCPLYREGGRRADDPDGRADVYREDERYYRISVRRTDGNGTGGSGPGRMPETQQKNRLTQTTVRTARLAAQMRAQRMMRMIRKKRSGL